MSIIVRRADMGDIEWIVSNFKEHDAAYPAKIPLYDPEISPKVLIDAMVNHVVFVAEESGRKLGYVAGWVFNHPINPSIKVLTQSLWYAVPGFAGSKAAKLLLEEFTKYGERFCSWIWVDLPVTAKVNERSLEKYGYRFQEKWYLKEVL